MKAFYTTKEAQTVLGLSHSNTVCSYIKEGFLRAIKVGGQWLIDSESLEKRVDRLKIINKNMKGV